MDYDNGFILQKAVDWSLLNDGMTIPVSVCSLFRAWDESILTHGQSKDIKILIDGEFYDAKLKNQNFVQSNWAGHKDVIQIRYGRNEGGELWFSDSIFFVLRGEKKQEINTIDLGLSPAFDFCQSLYERAVLSVL